MRLVLIALAAAALVAAQETRAFRVTERGEVVTFAEAIGPTRRVYVAPSGDDRDGDGSGIAPVPYDRARRRARPTPGTSVLKLERGDLRGGIVPRERSGAGRTRRSGSAARAGGPLAVIEGKGDGLHLSKASGSSSTTSRSGTTSGNGVNVDDGGDREPRGRAVPRASSTCDPGHRRAAATRTGSSSPGSTTTRSLDCQLRAMRRRRLRAAGSTRSGATAGSSPARPSRR